MLLMRTGIGENSNGNLRSRYECVSRRQGRCEDLGVGC